MTASTAAKLDLFKQHRAEYAAPRRPTLVDVAAAVYLAADGIGAPGAPEFQDRVGALYAMAYTSKFRSKAAGRDFAVCKLEGLWQLPDDGDATLDDARWTLAIRLPDFVGDAELHAARTELREKGKEGDFDAVGRIELTEGRCVQMLHVGSYEREHETIAEMTAFAEAQSLTPHLRHHEIYLSDPRRVPPDRLRTILRQPVRDA